MFPCPFGDLVNPLPPLFFDINSSYCYFQFVFVSAFFFAYQNFCRRAEFQSCISCVCPLAIVCVHQAKCWPRMKGLFPSGFNESVCCLLTKRPTPIHLDFLHVFFSVVCCCFFFFTRLICKEPSIYQMCPLNELVLV